MSGVSCAIPDVGVRVFVVIISQDEFEVFDLSLVIERVGVVLLGLSLVFRDVFLQEGDIVALLVSADVRALISEAFLSLARRQLLARDARLLEDLRVSRVVMLGLAARLGLHLDDGTAGGCHRAGALRVANDICIFGHRGQEGWWRRLDGVRK